MTAIAGFNINRCPILLGDLLVSTHGDENLKTNLNIPSIGEIEKIFPRGSGIIPTKLMQKVVLLNDNLTLAWSGSKLSAQIIINALLREANKKSIWSFDDLSHFFSNFNREHGNKVGIIGYTNDGKGIFLFGYGTDQIKYQSEKYGLVRLYGSGATDLKSYLDGFDIPLASRVTNPLETAVGNTLTITTYMTGLERITGSNLIKYYGGGFEIVSFVQKKFAKIDDITYIIWVGRQMEDLSWRLSLPEVAIKYSYHEDILLIRRVEFKKQLGNSLKCNNEAIYVVSPIYSSVDNIALEKIKLASFNSRFICNFIILYSIDGSVEILNRINYSDRQTGPIRFSDDTSKTLYLDIHSEFIKSIFEHSK